ncbi:MAG TPA: HAD family phosphatase, partial [Anaerolineae bacterium]|nr:HAD family phosphatase [Anaerolineae bacterium]
KALISDLGGVLLRTRTDGSRRALEQRLGLAPHTLEARVFDSEASLQAQRGEVSEEMMWRALERELDLPRLGLTAREFQDKFFEEDFVDEELVNLIRSVRPGVKTGLISNAWDGLREILHTRVPVIDAFDVIVISAEEKIAKPDPRLYLLTLERLGVQADEAIFLDDVSENVFAAQTLGLIGIHFHSSEQAQRDVRALLNGSGPVVR